MSSQAEAEARERLLVMGEIAAEVAHELRNVLQVISANAYLARQDPPASGPVIAKIERHARLAHAIVDDLMTLARGEAMQVEPTLLAEIVVAARADIQAGTATWADAIEPFDLRVRVHAGLAVRLLHALYENAILACAPRPPTVSTRARLEDGGVLIDVADDGPGVAPELAPRIFDPLVTGRSGGTGLGLALARRIIRAHGGTIELLPSALGATFRLRIPSGAQSET